MTTVLEYSKNITRLQHFKEYLLQNHPTLTINYIITNTGKNNQNHFVTIEFNGTLDASDITAVNTSIKTYTNPTDLVIDFTTVHPLQPFKVNTTSYQRVTNFNFNPSVGSLSTIKVNSMKNSNEAFTYSQKIIDVTNGTVISEKTGLNNVLSESIIHDTLNNIPTKSSILEIHTKLDSANSVGVIVDSLELLYCQ